MFDEIGKLLGPGGKFARMCPGYEHREEQIAMAEGVADAILRKEHLLVEAGTGVGKTVAYLAPAILHASKGKPAVISTHTINLQGQLVGKDIPLMGSVMDEHPFTAVLMKGRGNFVCLQEMDHAASLFDEDRAFKRLKEWVAKTETGDIGELDFSYPDWGEVCCNQDTCRHQECAYQAERCFYYKMRKAAAAADIVVVNHSLFFSDLSIRMVDPKAAIIPDHDVVVFDEAHHLEDVASETFGVEFSNYRVQSLVSRLKKRRELEIPPGELSMMQSANDMLFDSFSYTYMRKQEFFFDDLYAVADRGAVEENAQKLLTALGSLTTQLTEVRASAEGELKERIDGYRNMASRMADDLRAIFWDANPNYFRWAERPSGSRFVNCYLHYTPVSVASVLKDALWGGPGTVICTSATLSNSGTFCYLRNRLGTPESEELILGSPFDFLSQAMLYVPDDLDEPSEKPEYADSVAERIGELLVAAKGRAFMLFTSYRMLKAVFERLVDRVPYRLLKQGEMSNQRLLKEFRENDDTCLMGVHSFWEGVDVKGERLSCVIIDKLPFAVPDSPIHKARCDAIEREGGNWFGDYSIPQAQIRLKQGFGRLIRTQTDRGVVAILDSRIHRKRYGREFVRYLPHCKATRNLDRVKEFLYSLEPFDGSDYAVSEEKG